MTPLQTATSSGPKPAQNPLSRADVRAALPLLDRHKPKCGPVRKSKVGRWRALVLILVHVVIGLHIAHWLLSGETITPVEPSEAMQTFEEGKINAGFVLFTVLILGTLVFGRWFCGWACHVVALQDLSAWLLGRFGLRPRPVRSRLLILAPFAVGGHMFLWPHVRHWLSPEDKPMPRWSEWQWALTTDDLWATFPGPLMTVLTVVVVGFLIVWWMGAKGFCTYGCPYAAFFIVADRFSPGRIKVTDACDACGHCTTVCSSNVRVHEEVARHGKIVDPGCMKCMDCVSVCPKDALYFGAALPKPLTKSQQRIGARADFTWPEELLLAAAALGGTLAFRGAWYGEVVPFLLSVGLGAITATLVLLGWRLLRRRQVQFQHTELKRDGALRPAGRWALIGVAAWLLLWADTAAVQVQWWRAERIEARLPGRDQGPERARQLEAFDGLLQSAQGWALVADPRLHQLRGLALRELAVAKDDMRYLEQSEAQLRSALDVEPEMYGAMVPLADLLNLRGAVDEAEALLRRADALHPGQPEVQRRLQLLEQRRPR
ncbi:MAG: 4Fe-4S binding protein [Planctomycetota bacterium]